MTIDLNCYEVEPIGLYRWDANRVLIHITNYNLVLVPDIWLQLNEPSAKHLEYIGPCLSRLDDPGPEFSFQQFSDWSNRRQWTRADTEVEPDPQRVLTSTYNRVVIRDSIQWLYQSRTSPSACVKVREHSFSEIMKVLALGCGEWAATIVCMRDGHRCGDDPLFGDTNG